MQSERFLKVGKNKKMTNTFDLIMELKTMKVGEEKTIDGHRIKKVNKYMFEYLCSCCKGKSIAYGKR